MGAVQRMLIPVEVIWLIWKRIPSFGTLGLSTKRVDLFAGRFFPTKSTMLVDTAIGVGAIQKHREAGIVI